MNSISINSSFITSIRKQKVFYILLSFFLLFQQLFHNRFLVLQQEQILLHMQKMASKKTRNS